MKQIKEIWNLVFNWFGNGKKSIMGVAFLVIGFLWNWICYSASTEGLAQAPFVVMMTGALCLVDALFSKLSGYNINPLLFILIFIAIMDLGLNITQSADMDFTNMVAIWGACYLFVWALQYALLEGTGVTPLAKRVVLAFFETMVGAVAMVIVFVLPVLFAAIR